ncbi:hypothetical protein CB1_000691009 [Camelus ferus]|nr:hypothetical protein CB1_000691009 [Camelus ferus]
MSEAPQAMLPCLGALSRPGELDTPAREDTAAGAKEPEATLWAKPVRRDRGSRRGLFRSLVQRSNGLRGATSSRARSPGLLGFIQQAQKTRKEVTDHLAAGKDERAWVRVEQIIREDYLVEAVEIL